jgi:hypothetical protein
MLYSVKSIIVLHESNTIVASCSDSSDFVLCINNNGELSTNKSIISTTSTEILLDGTNYFVHNINVACSSKTAKVSTDTLTLADRTFKMQCEIVDEDDSYAVLLANNKFYITDEYLKAFKDSNVNEYYADKVLLNQKRKELLLDLFSIKSFIGTYAGLINALKYFGYDDDVIIKEFWSYFDKSINDYILVSKNIQENVNDLAIGFTKTNMFNITYRANDVSGYYSDDNLPQLISIFDNDITALIKMHNMRIVLETYFLPAHAIIVEIVGEHINFSSISTSYYLHNAIVNYYSTEIESLFDIVTEAAHQTLHVVLHDIPNIAVLNTDTKVVQISKIATIDDVNDNQMTFYVDNIAYCKLMFNDNFRAFIKTAKILVTNSQNELVFECKVDSDDIIIGFLHDDSYIINVLATDMYNVTHLHNTKLTTYFDKHSFDVFTVKNEILLPTLADRHEFKSTKEAFEFFEFKSAYDTLINEKTTIKYSALQSIHAYDKFDTNDAVGISSYKTYNNNEYPILQDMLSNTAPYRYMQSVATNVDTFVVSKQEYLLANDVLKQFLNKGLLSFYFELVEGMHTYTVNINNVESQFTVNLANVNSNNITSIASAVVNKFYSDKLNELASLNDLQRFDIYVYNLIVDDIAKPVMLFVDSQLSDILDTTCNIEHEFVNVSSDMNAIQYVHAITPADSAIECIVNDVSYTMLASVNSHEDLVLAIKALSSNYEELANMQAIVADNSVIVAFDKSFILSHNSFGSIGCFIREHLVNDLVKLDAGSDIMQYSIVFAKINESVKCRPHDIKWLLYEDSGNSQNLVVESSNYFFSCILKNVGSYTLVLEYKDKNDDSYTTKTVTKNGVFLVNNKVNAIVDNNFIESTKYANI